MHFYTTRESGAILSAFFTVNDIFGALRNICFTLNDLDMILSISSTC